MNKHQETALAGHCRFAFETAQSKFCYLIYGPSFLASVVLTVNSGYE